MNIEIETNPIHPATACCLEALQWLHERHACRNILEIGCGNGVLSLMAAGLWKTGVLAVDIAEQAVRDTEAHSKAHGLDHFVTAIRSDGFANSVIKSRAPYDLIIINLLAEPIIQMRPDVHLHLVANGTCLLSGIRTWEETAVLTAYEQAGFGLKHRIHRSPWHALLMKS